MLSERAAENIKRLREAKGLSQAKLAARCVPPTVYQQIDKLETGERRMTLDWLERIAQALNVNALELMGSEPTAWQTNLSEPVAAEVARTLSRVVLRGAEPDSDTVSILALMLVEFANIFRRYPQALTDPAVAGPVLEFAGRQYAQQAS